MPVTHTIKTKANTTSSLQGTRTTEPIKKTHQRRVRGTVEGDTMPPDATKSMATTVPTARNGKKLPAGVPTGRTDAHGKEVLPTQPAVGKHQHRVAKDMREESDNQPREQSEMTVRGHPSVSLPSLSYPRLSSTSLSSPTLTPVYMYSPPLSVPSLDTKV
jgi:hypothetical protein